MIAVLSAMITRADRLMRWLTPASLPSDTRYGGSYDILARIALVTLPFSLLYVLVSYIIGFRIGVWLMTLNFLAIMAVLWMFRETGRYRLCANLYLAACFFLGVLGNSIFTGGIHSMVMPWFVLIPVASALLLNSSPDTRNWTALSCTTVIAYLLADLLEYKLPFLYQRDFVIFFNASCIVGLVLILSIFAIVFGNFIRQQKQFSDDIINTLPDMFFMLDENGRFLRANQAFHTVAGVSANELGSVAVQDFFDGADKALITQRMREAFDHGSSKAEATFITKSGKRLPYYFSGARINLDRRDCLVCQGNDLSARTQAELARQESELRYRSFIEQLPLGIAVIQQGVIKYANHAMAGFSGYAIEDLLDHEFLPFAHEDDRPWLHELHQKRMRGEDASSRYVIRARRKDGEIRYWEIHASLTNWEGAPSALGIINDITERHQLETQLFELSTFNRKTIESSPLGIATYDAETGQCVSANDSSARIVGSALDEFLQMNFHTLASWQNYGMLQMAKEALSSGQSVKQEAHITTSFGKELWANISMTEFLSQGRQYILLTMEDISIRKKAENALQLQSEITAHAAEGIALIKATDSRILYTNPRFDDLFGYAHGELSGMPVSCLNAGDSRTPQKVTDEINRSLADQGTWHGEIMSRKKDGSAFWTSASISSFQHPEYGTLWMTYQSDITERKNSEAALLAATNEARRSSRAKSVFLASVSHDLRQPLSALSIMVDVLREKFTPENDRLWHNMRHCVDDLSKMLANLLDLSKLEAGAVKPDVHDFPVDEVIRNCVLSYTAKADAKGITLRVRCGNLASRTDPVLLQRIVRNLVSNAVRYTERGGVLVACRRRQGRHWIEVWDSGMGIPADKHEEIFEEFRQLANPERSQTKGSGLGLAIVAKTATLLGLQIRVRSREGRGSMFAVEIPPGTAVSPTATRKYEQRPLHIALIEDNASVAEAIAMGLEETGHQVTFAPSAAELLPLLNNSGMPALVISDYRLGGNENGLDAIAAVQQQFNRPIPGLIITGDTDPSLIGKLHASGVLFLHKPLNLARLRLTIMELTSAVGDADLQ